MHSVMCYDDEMYCQKLYQDYLEDMDPDKDETYTLDECKKEWGVIIINKFIVVGYNIHGSHLRKS